MKQEKKEETPVNLYLICTKIKKQNKLITYNIIDL